VYDAAAIVREMAHPDVNLIFGAVIDDNMVNRIRVTVVATGFDRQGPRQQVIEQRKTQQSPPPANETSTKPSSTPTKKPVGQNAWSRPNFANDDLSIPAFLRRR